jgi:precorrin-6A/cobalt-precorrin-6A reductase
MAKRLLILGGTAEAAELARRTAEATGDRIEVMTSLAGRLQTDRRLPGRVRVGGFGGASGLGRFLREASIDLVVDATHPFAENISRNAASACASACVPRLVLVRPPWRPEPGDRWLNAGNVVEAAELLPAIARRAFLTTGPGSLAAFRNVADVWFLVRLFVRPAAPLPLADHQILQAQPPFTLAAETALMRKHRIDTLVTKQSGGPTDAKLAAARACGAQVVMIQRPAPPPGDAVDNVDAALAWMRGRS